ncbi:HNH endonuclease signature motif containing protein [Janibacter melonis]|uniref:HNH endonuclease signature motif containing protein n=1 Tax=Janibacter melonis TaxID=262209 RepID=UPI00191A8F2C|nr:HNH endonuclease signature motif containing protein [Janibacter melonis]
MATTPQLLDPGTPGQSRVPALLDQAHAVIDSLQDAIVADQRTAGRALRADLVEVERLARRVEAARLRLVARADTVRVAERTGHTDTGAWVAQSTNSDRRPASRDVRLATALTAPGIDSAKDSPGLTLVGTDTPAASAPRPARQAELAQTATALDDGRISAEHARVITSAMADLPETLTPEQRRTCEAELLLLAITRAPAKLRIAARRVLETVEPDQDVVDAHEDHVLTTEETHAHDESAFWIRDNHDGTMTGHFTVPWAAGAILGKVIDAMTAPRRRVQAGSDAVVTEPSDLARLTGDTRVDELDWQHRRGLAFADLLTRIPTDHLSRKVAATLLVTTRLDDLTGQLHRAGSTDAGDHLDAGTIRRMACAAGIIPVVLGGPSQPLDLARQKRLFTEAQAVALSLRYDTCAADGCARPFAWTEIHHLTAWRDGGLTDLRNAIPLCGYHHRMIDGPDWQHTTQRAPDDTITIHFHRRT